MMGTPRENTATSDRVVDRQHDRQNPRPEGPWYEIRVKGHLGSEWSGWFEGLEFKPFEDGQRVLCGHIVDQAALLGVLTRLNRLNLALLSVQSVKE